MREPLEFRHNLHPILIGLSPQLAASATVLVESISPAPIRQIICPDARQSEGPRHQQGNEIADLLRDCRRRGMTAPVLAVGYGALGFWAALREAFPAT